MAELEASQMIAAATPQASPQTERRDDRQTAMSVRKLWKRYGRIEAIRGIDLEIMDGEIFGLIGPDGA